MSASTLENFGDDDRTHRVFMRHEKRYMKQQGFVVGIVGSREWNNTRKIDQVVTSLQRKREGLSIVSGGADGADAIAKQVALDHGIPYKEFTPEHENANKWTVQQNRRFGKEYSPHFFFKRNSELAKYVDLLVAFIPQEYVGDSEKARGTRDTITKARKRDSTQVMLLQ